MEVLSKLLKYYQDGNIAHAYLIETNNIEKCYKDLTQIIKQMICPNEYKENCTKCNMCNLINENLLPSYILIEPNGKNIKKEQVIDLQSRFSTKPIYTKENIYVIKNAERLNNSSANTMLKFLEEPENNIIGFLITNNINYVISTIKSRCEIIKNYYNEESNNSYYNVAFEYIKKIELEKIKTILYNKEVITKNYPEIFQLEELLRNMIIIYDNTLNGNIDKKEININKECNLKYILKQEKIVNKYLENINNNVNIELFLDSLVIELSGLDDEEKNV